MLWGNHPEKDATITLFMRLSIRNIDVNYHFYITEIIKSINTLLIRSTMVMSNYVEKNNLWENLRGIFIFIAFCVGAFIVYQLLCLLTNVPVIGVVAKWLLYLRGTV